VAQDGDDGCSGAGPCLGVAERAGGVRRIGGHRKLLDDEPLGLPLQDRQPEGQLRGAEDLGDGVRFVVAELDGVGGAVAFLVVEHELAQPAAPGDDADPVPVVQIDFLAHADSRQYPAGDVDIHLRNTTGMIAPGSLEWRPVSADLVAAPVLKALDAWPPDADVVVAPIDPSLADTAAFCERYQVSLDDSANCVVIAGRRADITSYAVCVVLATTRVDVNGVVRRRLGARKASFAPMDDAVRLSGMEYGGITPIGLPDEWPVLIDAAVLGREVVVIGSGVRASKIALPSALLARLPTAEVVEGLAS
jgi:prolyl-tRNA editing enzyme YbaK/EbsC (Cys-tRNA(Pro) deacylase)